MAVPNTSTFTLQQVVNEVGASSNPTLSNCFSLAIKSGFVSSYVGSKDRLSNFRGYSHGSSYYLY
tara:strand:- start:765 stop:959 length:195 start_codon:yes stop_codon:yes gene_type:complete